MTRPRLVCGWRCRSRERELRPRAACMSRVSTWTWPRRGKGSAGRPRRARKALALQNALPRAGDGGGLLGRSLLALQRRLGFARSPVVMRKPYRGGRRRLRAAIAAYRRCLRLLLPEWPRAVTSCPRWSESTAAIYPGRARDGSARTKSRRRCSRYTLIIPALQGRRTRSDFNDGDASDARVVAGSTSRWPKLCPDLIHRAHHSRRADSPA